MEDKPAFLIPEGSHIARARKWVWETTNNGDPMLVIDFAGALEQGAPEDAETTMGDRSVWHRMAFTAAMTEKQVDQRVKELRAMGFVGDNIGTITEDAGGLDANLVRLEIEHENYDGKWREKIKWVNALRSTESRLTARNPPSPAMLQALSQQMKVAFGGASGASKPAAGQQTGQGQRAPQQPAQRQQASAAARTSAQSAQTNGRAAAEPWAAGPPPGFGDDDTPF